MSDVLSEVETALPPHFHLIPQLSQEQNVYGRIIYRSYKRISQRVYTPIHQVDGVWQWKTFPTAHTKVEPFRVTFAKKTLIDNELLIVPTGGERLVYWRPYQKWVRPLWGVIHNYKEQLAEVDKKCDRCDNGVYRNGNTCYRCEGKGYTNHQDRRRNQLYDEYRARSNAEAGVRHARPDR